MTVSGSDTGGGFDADAYARASRGLNALGLHLPEERVEALAREVLARIGGHAPDTGPDRTPFPEPECGRRVALFCTALLAEDPDAAARMIERAQRFGVSVEEIYLAYLTPGARHLGTLWRTNRASFAEVAIGISRIYGIMRGLRDSLPLTVSLDARRAAFASVPGEEHSLGVSVAADLFRKDGWTVDLHVGLDHDALLDRLIEDRPPIIGLSAASDAHVPELISLLAALHAAHVPARILIAGAIVGKRPDIAALTGADAAAEGYRAARDAAEHLWASLSGAARRHGLN